MLGWVTTRYNLGLTMTAQQCVAIGELVCDNKRIAMVHMYTLVFSHSSKLKIMDFLRWKVNSSYKRKLMIEWAYVSWKSSFPYEVHKILKAKSKRCIMNAVTTIEFIGWILYKLSTFTWRLELFKKLGVFFPVVTEILGTCQNN